MPIVIWHSCLLALLELHEWKNYWNKMNKLVDLDRLIYFTTHKTYTYIAYIFGILRSIGFHLCQKWVDCFVLCTIHLSLSKVISYSFHVNQYMLPCMLSVDVILICRPACVISVVFTVVNLVVSSCFVILTVILFCRPNCHLITVVLFCHPFCVLTVVQKCLQYVHTVKEKLAKSHL